MAEEFGTSADNRKENLWREVSVEEGKANKFELVGPEAPPVCSNHPVWLKTCLVTFFVSKRFHKCYPLPSERRGGKEGVARKEGRKEM